MAGLAVLPVNLAFVGLAYLPSPFLARASVLWDLNPLPGRWQSFPTLDADLGGGVEQGIKVKAKLRFEFTIERNDQSRSGVGILIAGIAADGGNAGAVQVASTLP
ncbi:hypothetical protein [Rhizobium laguerreae]|uniref:hypothetical protein n=1 Tax=Rhizobium laguerreae TaxID=1076926 RepID=UPI001C90348F|nr:hypothetical protein [Rhizobium laguerreae]